MSYIVHLGSYEMCNVIASCAWSCHSELCWGMRCEINHRTNRVAHSVTTKSRFWLSQGHLVAEYASRPGIGH